MLHVDTGGSHNNRRVILQTVRHAHKMLVDSLAPIILRDRRAAVHCENYEKRLQAGIFLLQFLKRRRNFELKPRYVRQVVPQIRVRHVLDQLEMFLPHAVPVHQKSADCQRYQHEPAENPQRVVVQQILRRDCNFGLLVLVHQIANPVAVNVVNFLVEDVPEFRVTADVDAQTYRLAENRFACRLQRINPSLVH